LAVPASVCAANAEADRYYEQAQFYIAKSDWPAALIELKNAVRADPESAALRFSLGVTYLHAGDPASAEKELKAARDRGFDINKLLPPLAEAYVVQGEYKQLLDTIPAQVSDPEVTSEILSWRGYVYLGLQ